MIKITKLTLKNFLSVGAVTLALNLDQHGLTLVLGSNTDSNGGLTRNGAGKAQPLDCKIKTPFGWKRMGDMKVGDLVDTPSGRYGRVDGVFPQGSIPVYRITFADGRSTEACGDHIWKTWSRSGDWKWSNKTTKELADHIDGTPNNRSYVPLIQDISAPEIDLPIHPRLMGIMLGDGYMSGLSFSSKDREIVDFVMENTPDEYYLSAFNDCDYRITRGAGKKGHDCRLRQVLAFYGLTQTKSNSKFIPDAFKQGSLNQRLDLLSGLIDTDGHVGKNGDVSYTTVSKTMADDVCEMIRSIGGIAKITSRIPSYTYKGERKNGQRAYTVKIRYKNPRALVRLPRKLARMNEKYQYADTLRLEIKTIELIGNKEAQCISIDDHEHLYITDDYIVTHNTTILQAISYALYGTPISKIKADNLINNINQKGMLVTIEFERDGKTYRVERGRKPNILKFFVNSEEIETDPEDISQGENRHTQEMINQAVGMSNTMFKHIVALNTYTDPFLRMKSGDQREVIEELLGVTQISLRAETLKKLSTQTKEAIRDQDANIRAVREANNRIQSAIDNATRMSDDWEARHAARVNTLLEEIAAMESIDYDAEIASFDVLDSYLIAERKAADDVTAAQREVEHFARDVRYIEGEISRLQKDMGTVSSAALVSRLKTEISRKEKEVTRNLNSIQSHENQIAKVIADMSSEDNQICVCCGQALQGTDHLATVIANLKATEDKLRGEAATFNTNVVALQSEITELLSEIGVAESGDATRHAEQMAQLADLRDRLAVPLAALELHEDALKAAVAAKAALGAKPQTIFSSRDEVYKTKSLFDGLARELDNEKAQTNPNVAQIETLTSTLQPVDTTALDELTDLFKHQEFLLKLLTSKDSFIRKKIIDQNLAYLNSRLNFYLDKLGLPHEVRFQSDLSVDITLLGRDFDFEQLSRGEMNRVIMATSWSFRDVWESLNDSFNLLFVDEMLDQGTDGHGVEAALTILKSMARDRSKNVFLISHRDDLTARIDRTLLVRKENGFTRFEEDTLV